MNNDLVSIIIPVYNVKDFLPECIDSVLNQTYKNIEIILIDDGSSDGSEIICDDYAKSSPLIKVIHKENGGLSDARNCGLSLCEGMYVTFLDSDDSIANTYVEKLYKLVTEHNAAVASISYEKVDYFGLKIKGGKRYSKNSEPIVYNREEVIQGILLRTFNCAAWGSIYSKQVLKNVRFVKGRKNEDVLFWMDLLDEVDSVVYADVPLYYYRMRDGSLTSGTETYWDAIENAVYIQEKIAMQYPNLLKFSEYNYFYYLFLYAKFSTKNDKKRKLVISRIRKNLHKIFSCRYFSILQKLQLLLLSMNLNISKSNIKRI